MLDSEITKKDILLLLSEIIGDNFNTSISIRHKNFIGFFQWNSIDETLTYNQRCSLAIKHFEIYFQNYIDSIIIASSLIVDSNILQQNQLEYKLALNGFILPLNYNLLFNEDKTNYNKVIDNQDIDHVYNEIISSFRIFSKNSQIDLTDLSYVSMESDILTCNSGYLFYLIPSLNLIIYPHDDIGFGCFFIQKKKSFKIGVDFINTIKHEKGNWLIKIIDNLDI